MINIHLFISLVYIDFRVSKFTKVLADCSYGQLILFHLWIRVIDLFVLVDYKWAIISYQHLIGRVQSCNAENNGLQ